MNIEDRLEQLEIRLAWQDETIDRLSDIIAKMQEAQDLQQAQLRYLYTMLENRSRGFDAPHEKPPHY